MKKEGKEERRGREVDELWRREIKSNEGGKKKTDGMKKRMK